MGQVSNLSLESAGDIGGLLAVFDARGTRSTGDDVSYVCLYNANGDVGQVIDWNAASASASIKAHYEYDLYGSRINAAVPGEYDQPWRFSSKGSTVGTMMLPPCPPGRMVASPMGRTAGTAMLPVVSATAEDHIAGLNVASWRLRAVPLTAARDAR